MNDSSQTQAFDRLAGGIEQLASAVYRASRETIVSRRVSLFIAVVTVGVCLFVARIGTSVLKATEDTDAQIRAWNRQIFVWKKAQRVESERRSNEMEASASLAAALQKSIEAQATRDKRERAKALSAAEKHAIAAEVKATVAQMERATQTEAPTENLSRRLREAQKKAQERDVSLEEF